MNNKLAAALSWLCLPVYIWQGLGVRRSSLRLSPPSRQSVSAIEGKGKPIYLLLVGDSSAAGVGVKDIRHSLGGQLVEILAKNSGRPVKIRIAGCNSATAGQIRDFTIPNIEREQFTHVILNIGTNDAKNFHTSMRFKREFGTLIYAINSRFPNADIIWSGIIDLSAIPALPTPLNKVLGIRSRELVRRGTAICQERSVEIPKGEWDTSIENFLP